ncbi:MAG: hypothetical protein V3U33_04020, partial [candidate division NC10 bacterium]
ATSGSAIPTTVIIATFFHPLIFFVSFHRVSISATLLACDNCAKNSREGQLCEFFCLVGL